MPEQVADEDFGPCLKPPFYTLHMGGFGKLISDMEGRTLLVEHGKSEFVDELCKIMNENKERLVKAWKKASRSDGQHGSRRDRARK